jgi:hypothetical protein
MTEPLPKIWNTTFSDHSNGRNIDFHLPNNTQDRCLALSRAFLYPEGKPLTPDLVPDYIFFNLRDLAAAYRAKTPDWVTITGGVFVISEKFRDFLVGFELGATQIFEVPLYEYDQKTQRPGRWFILNICATKDTLLAEQSQGLESRGKEGNWRSRIAQEDVLAVRASSAEGADIWIDPHIFRRIFLSDRLKSAIKPAGIRVRFMPLRPCIVIA